MMDMTRSRFRAAVVGATLGVAMLAGQAQGELVYATSQTGSLISFDSASPMVVLSGMAIQGLQANETVRGIDFRPRTGELYALGSFNNLYTLNPLSAQASFVAALSVPTNGVNFGFDFNPTVDRIRIVSEVDQNLRANPVDGVTVVDGTLAYGAGDPNFGTDPNVVHAAYTPSSFGQPPASTTLYVLDTGLDVLAIQSPANAGTLMTVGSVGTDLTELGGFDISPVSGNAFAAVRGVNPDRSTFWSINLATGQGAQIGDIGGGIIVTGIAIVPAPGAAGLLGLGALAAFRRRR